MRDELDEDTVIVPPRAASPAAGPDLEDTVVASSVPRRPQPAPRPQAPTAPRVSAPAASGQSSFSYRIGQSDAVALDRPSLIGRRPSAPRVSPQLPPRLVRVASPRNEVSATHLEVRQLGSTVVVTDLRSTNGTIVRLPGHSPQRLRQGESVVVTPGALVDIGDGNIIEILPRRIAEEGKQ